MIITEKKKINCEIQELFDLSQQMNRRPIWDDQVKELGFMEGYDELRKGAKVFVNSSNGVKMETIYTSFVRPYKISVEMLNYSKIFKSFSGQWEYVDEGEKATTLQISYTFKLRLIYKLLSPLVQKKIRGNIRKKLTNLSLYVDQN